MAKILDKDPFTYQKERDSFLRDLSRFHAGRGSVSTCFLLITSRSLASYFHSIVRGDIVVLRDTFAVSIAGPVTVVFRV